MTIPQPENAQPAELGISAARSQAWRALSRRGTEPIGGCGLVMAETTGRTVMESEGVGWIAAIIIGGIAGWLAEKITSSNMGILANIIIGVIGAGIASWLFTKLGVAVPGSPWIAYLISGFVGACLLLIVTRIFYPNRFR
jgi:uncharacterized membrane protein YeaQ/YmgE (transglycosylase-associated protein family)